MDTKKDIDAALQRLGKDRKWLAEKTGYSYFSVRDCLAPDGKNLSRRMESAFRAAIDAEQHAQAFPAAAPVSDRIVLEPDADQYSAWSRAANNSGKELKHWAIESLDDAAANWSGLKVAEKPVEYRTARSQKKGL